MRAIIYTRKSSESEDRQVMSLTAQENEMRKIAEREGLEVVEVFQESMSAKAPGRPLFAEMLQMVVAGEADCILCWKLDRLARNPIDGGSVNWMLQQNQIKAIITYERTYLPSDNVLLMSVEFGMSNQYIRELSANVKRGNREKLRRGEWPCRAPYGYFNDKNTKTLKIVSKESEKVLSIYEDYATGKYSFSQLARKYHLSKSQIGRILSRTFYYGVMELNGQQYPGTHKSIISKELFDRAQTIKAGVTVTHPRPQKLDFTYRGLMRCAECGCQLTATRKKGQYDYYYCTNGKGICTQSKSYLTSKAVDQLFADALTQIQFDEELVEIMYLAAREKLENGSYDTQKVLDAISLQIHNLKEQEKRLAHSFTLGAITEDVLIEEAKRLNDERKELEARYANYSRNAEMRVGTLELTKKVFLEANKAFSEFIVSDSSKKRSISENLLWNLEVKDKKVANYKFRSPYQVLAKASKNGDMDEMLGYKDSNITCSVQVVAIFHSSK